MSYGNYGYAPFYAPNFYQQNGAASDFANQIKRPPTQASDITWVQGESGAKAYFVPANSIAVLWDSENPTIYVKSADASGIPSMRVLDFTERIAESPVSPSKGGLEDAEGFVKRSDLEALQDEIDNLKSKVDALNTKAASKTTKKGADE